MFYRPGYSSSIRILRFVCTKRFNFKTQSGNLNFAFTCQIFYLSALKEKKNKKEILYIYLFTRKINFKNAKMFVYSLQLELVFQNFRQVSGNIQLWRLHVIKLFKLMLRMPDNATRLHHLKPNLEEFIIHFPSDDTWVRVVLENWNNETASRASFVTATCLNKLLLKRINWKIVQAIK